MVICICFDKNFQRWATVSLYSVVQQSNTSIKPRLFIITDINYNSFIKELKSILQKFDFTIINSSSQFDELPTGYHFTTATYWRLNLPKILSDYNVEKAIYIDTDVLVLEDLQELYNIDLSNYSCAGVLDFHSNREQNRMNLKQGFVINCGVMLLNIELIKNIDWLTQAKEIGQNGLIKWVDQDVINIVLDGNIKLLDSKWNWQTGNSNSSSFVQPFIVHFTEGGSAKPWHVRCNNGYVGRYRRLAYKCGFQYTYLRLEVPRYSRMFFKKVASFLN